MIRPEHFPGPSQVPWFPMVSDGFRASLVSLLAERGVVPCEKLWSPFF